MSNGIDFLSLRSRILGPGEEEGQTIRGIMRTHCKKTMCQCHCRIGKGLSGLGKEQVSPRGGADDHNKGDIGVSP